MPADSSCTPFRRDVHQNLDADEVLKMFCTITTQQQLLCSAPPVLPKA